MIPKILNRSISECKVISLLIKFMKYSIVLSSLYAQTGFGLDIITTIKDKESGETTSTNEGVPLGDCNTLDINPKITEKFERYGNVLM